MPFSAASALGDKANLIEGSDKIPGIRLRQARRRRDRAKLVRIKQNDGGDAEERKVMLVGFCSGACGWNSDATAARVRKAVERTVAGLWHAIGRIVDTFRPTECANYVAAAECDAD